MLLIGNIIGFIPLNVGMFPFGNFHAPVVYWLGRKPFKLEKADRYCSGVPILGGVFIPFAKSKNDKT